MTDYTIGIGDMNFESLNRFNWERKYERTQGDLEPKVVGDRVYVPTPFGSVDLSTGEKDEENSRKLEGELIVIEENYRGGTESYYTGTEWLTRDLVVYSKKSKDKIAVPGVRAYHIQEKEKSQSHHYFANVKRALETLKANVLKRKKTETPPKDITKKL